MREAKLALLVKERDAMPDKPTGNAEIGRRLRQLRLSKGLSQEELGNLLDPKVDQTTISTWETGAVDVSTAAVLQLIKLLDTTSSFIYLESDDPLSPAAHLRAMGLDPGNVDVLEEIDRKLVRDLAERLRRPPQVQGERNDPGDTAATGSG